MDLLDSALGRWLLLWLLACAVLVLHRLRAGRAGTGLVYVYLVGLWAIHWLPALLYVLPWHRFRNVDVVEAGLGQSTLAIWAFVAGSVVLAPGLERVWRIPPPRPGASPGPRPAVAYLGAAVAFYLLARVPALQLPTLTALLATGQSLLVAALCLSVWTAWRKGRSGVAAGWLAVTLLLPLVTIVSSGFMGQGALGALTVFVFAGSLGRPRVSRLLLAGLIAYVGLSFYVGYMRDRTEIREAVWGGRSLEARLQQMADTVSRFEWFDPADPLHVWAVNSRLNQNVFVGIARDRLRYEQGEGYAWGATLVDAALALVPRALWPEKPVTAGSGDLVSRYTGIRFAEGTSVGIGQVLEFYVNFGPAGVAGGFLVLGVALTLIDATARRRLEAEDHGGFALWLLVGTAFLQSGGSLVELAGAAGAGATIVLLVTAAHRELSQAPSRARAPRPTPA
jgi:hypothetical protein